MKLETGNLKRHISTRRDFLRFWGRCGLLGVGSLVVARLMGRGQVIRPSETRCVNQGICSGCGKYPACGLPQALSRRQAAERVADDRNIVDEASRLVKTRRDATSTM